MPTPSWVTPTNVKFNGTLDNAAILRDTGSEKTVILWDDLSSGDQDLLTSVVDAFGGDVPLTADTAGNIAVTFSSSITGSTATGLSNVSSSTAGKATIDLGSAKAGSDPSGLSSAAGTAGSNTVNFQPPVTGSMATGLSSGTPATSGHQDIAWTGLVGGSSTGLANDSTAYTATITVDGVAKPISVVGSAAQTFTTLISEINTDLGASAVASIVSATIFRVTSATTGVSSTVAIVNGTLFTALTGAGSIQTAVPGTAAVIPTYTATITVDGVAKPISVTGPSAQTFTTLISEINTDLGASATATISGGDIKVTSATTGLSSKVSIAPGTLFPALTGYVGVLPPANGGGTPRSYSATVVIDGVLIKTVKFTGLQGNTVQHVIDEINTDLGSSATAALTGGDIVITSATTGANSSVKVLDTGFLFNSLTGFVGISYVAGTAPMTYTATITVDGVAKPISVVGSAAQTMTTLVSEINTDLGASATASITSGTLKITSATTGTGSKVLISDNTLFKSLTGFASISAPVNGAEDFVDVLKTLRAPSGSTLFEHFNVQVVGLKPAVPPYTPHSIHFIYFDGSIWKYLDDDTDV